MLIKDIILILAVICLISCGFFFMKRIDKFLYDNENRIEQEEQQQTPSYEIFSTKISDKELVERIRAYEKTHGNACIALYEDKDDI